MWAKGLCFVWFQDNTIDPGKANLRLLNQQIF